MGDSSNWCRPTRRWALVLLVCHLSLAGTARAATVLAPTRQPTLGCPAPAQGDPAAAASAQKVLAALQQELQRFVQATVGRAGAPVHFAALRVTERRAVAISASLGGLLRDDTDAPPERVLDVSVRVGDRHIDSSHPLRGGHDVGTASGRGVALPLGDDERALRTVAWRALDDAYDLARQRYLKVRANAQVTATPEDQSDDFSEEARVDAVEPLPPVRWPDLGPVRQRLLRLSAELRGDPEVQSSQVELSAYQDRRYLVTSEGTRVVSASGLAMVSAAAEGLSEDGTELSRRLVRYARSIEELPGEAELRLAVRGLRDELHRLRRAKVLDPYSGPVLLEGRAAAVLFHEVLGHRLEGQRQRGDRESGTFSRRVGQRVMPSFLNITDDPTRGWLGPEALNGCYRHDDEGVAAAPVPLVERGVLRTFLLGRQPARGFVRSNGHGRAGVGNQPVGRQGNLIVSAEGALPAATARTRLLEEVRKSGRPYGLRVAEISGGFTSTGRGQVEGMKILPETVYRVYADGRPDELVRGVHVIGTPLTVLEHVVAAFDDPAVFNGQCGAESGWVPVAAVSPSLLVQQMEMARAPVEGHRAPLLPPPPAVPGLRGELAALGAELERAQGLRLDRAGPPYFLALRADLEDSLSLSAELGSMLREGHSRARQLAPLLRVGDMRLDSGGYQTDGEPTWHEPLGEDALAERWDAWQALDRAYKGAVEGLSRHQAQAAEEADPEPVDDFSPAPKVVSDRPVVVEGVPEATRALWRARLQRVSAAGRELPAALPAGVVLESAACGLDAVARQRTLVNSEGTRVISGSRLAGLWLAASARAPDGMPVRLMRRFFARSVDELPREAALLDAARALTAETLAVAGAPLLQNYDGPVLFESDAAAQMVQALLGRFVADSRPPRQARGRAEGPLSRRLGRRVTAPALDLVDDPLLEALGGAPLLGGYAIDDEGVRAERVPLVQRGVLVGLLSSRRPTRDVRRSNGHGRSFALQRFPEAAPSNLIASVAAPLDGAALRQRLLQEAAAAQVAEPLIIRRVGVSGGKGTPPQVWVLSAVVLGKDGKERPVRGGELSYVAPRLLRGLVAASQRRTVYTALLDEDGDEEASGVPVTVVAPDLLLRDIEVQGLRGPFPRPRLLPPP